MSKTCECGHHEAVHRAMCGAPEGCSCNKFVPATPLPAERLAEMTGAELADWWFAQNRNAPVTMAALRDAIRAEADADHREAMMRATREADRADETAAHWKRVAERAEREVGGLTADRNILQASVDTLTADLSRSRDAHNVAIRERDNATTLLAALAQTGEGV